MRKLFVSVAALVIALSLFMLCGCGQTVSAEEKACRKAEALLAKEDYHGAISALTNIDGEEADMLLAYCIARRYYAVDLSDYPKYIDDARERFRELGDYRDAAQYTAFYDCFGDFLPEKLEAVLAWEGFSEGRAEKTFDHYMSKNAHTLENRIKGFAFLNAFNELAHGVMFGIYGNASYAIEEAVDSIDMIAASLAASEGGKAVVCEARPYEKTVSFNMEKSRALPAELRPMKAEDVTWLIVSEIDSRLVGSYTMGGSAWKLVGTIKLYKAGHEAPVYTSAPVEGGAPPAVIHNTTGATGSAPDMAAAMDEAIVWLQTADPAYQPPVNTEPAYQPPEITDVTNAEQFAELEALCGMRGYELTVENNEIMITDSQTYLTHTADSIYKLMQSNTQEAEMWRTAAQGGVELTTGYQQIQALSPGMSVSFYITGEDGELLFWAQNGTIHFDATGLT